MSKSITVQQAREYVELGVVAHVAIVRAPMGMGWHLLLDGKSGSQWYLATARSKSPREFATVDAAVNALAAIGVVGEVLQVGALGAGKK